MGGARKSQQVLLNISNCQLVEADPRVTPEHPPAWALFTDLTAYHQRRADVLTHLLVKATIPYFIKTNQPMKYLPTPPPFTMDDL